jgi:hypothetical protein
MDMPIAFLVFKAILYFVVPIAVCTQQLIVTKRMIREDREREAAAAAAREAAAPPPVTAPETARPTRVRELEPA